jgi:hypothetical protein
MRANRRRQLQLSAMPQPTTPASQSAAWRPERIKSGLPSLPIAAVSTRAVV